MVGLESLDAEEDITELKTMIEKHLANTQSDVAKNILDNWQDSLQHFIKVMPTDYKRVLQSRKAQTQSLELEAV